MAWGGPWCSSRLNDCSSSTAVKWSGRRSRTAHASLVARIQLYELVPKLGLVVVGGWGAAAGDEESAQRVEGHVARAIYRAGAKLDRRDMPLTDGAQAH